MTRSWNINGPTMVQVRFGDHLSDGATAYGPVRASPHVISGSISTYELGLSVDPITVTPTFYHRDIRADDFGPHVPPEVMALLADVRISMRLVHFDAQILDWAMAESLGGVMLGGAVNVGGPMFDPTGDLVKQALPPAGSLLGNGTLLTASGCHYMSVILFANDISTVFPGVDPTTFTWTFPACYLPKEPVTYPLGTQNTIADVTWRAIPYVSPIAPFGLSTGGGPSTAPQEVSSSGVVLWRFD